MPIRFFLQAASVRESDVIVNAQLYRNFEESSFSPAMGFVSISVNLRLDRSII